MSVSGELVIVLWFQLKARVVKTDGGGIVRGRGYVYHPARSVRAGGGGSFEVLDEETCE